MTLLAVAMAQAADPAATTVTGVVTPTLNYFTYSDGPGDSYTQYMERYNAQEAWFDERDQGFYGDLHVDLTVGDVLTLEREGYGFNNNRNRARLNTESIGVTGYYNNFRSATGGIDYLYNPNLLPADNNGIGGTDPAYFYPAVTNSNSGYLAQFNDDTGSQNTFDVDRTTYGLGVKLKPNLIGNWGSIALNYDGYKRDGNKFVTYVLGGGDVREAVTNASTPSRVLQRWRGMSQDVDENMNKFSVNITAAPSGKFQLAYDGSYEKFTNNAQDYTHADIILPPEWQYNTGGDITRPLGFVPDATKTTHALRFSMSQGSTAFAAGYGMSRLEQDSFTNPQVVAGYTTGKISTENAFFNLNHRFSPTLGMDGYIRYLNRDNDSSFPVPGLIDPTGSEQLGVRINNIETMSYGVSGTMRALPMKSMLTAGWKHEDTDRDLTFNDTGIIPGVSLYREETVSDELYLTWVARMAQGVTLRVTPSYLWADKTGLVTEPEEAFNLRLALGYAASDGMQFNGYYNYKSEENGNNSFTDKVVAPTVPLSYTQNLDNVFHSAGASVSLTPAERLNATVSFDWNQNDFETYYFSTNRRRFESAANGVIFALRGDSNYKIDTWSLSLNGDYEASDALKLSAGYTYSVSDGSGVTIDTIQDPDYVVREEIDNSLHSLMLGATYGLNKSMTLRGGYIYDKYDDNFYDSLSGGAHTVILGLSIKM
jgi:hypothetical protein